MSPIIHTNRSLQTYYLDQGTTKTDKPRYFFSIKSEGTLVDEIPDGFEIFQIKRTATVPYEIYLCR